MKKIILDYNTYELKFRMPFITSKGIFNLRKGFIIELKDDKGIIGIGDAAPFKEFGSESFEETEEVLNRIDINLPAEFEQRSIIKIIDDILTPLSKFPALRCGLEQALISYISKSKKIDFSSIFGLNSNRIVPVNAFIGMLPINDTLFKVQKYVNEGFETIKLKIGRDDFDEELKIISEIFSSFPDIKLRLDANAKWNYEEAFERLIKMEDFPIDYIEQPVKSREDMVKIIGNIDIPFAADESIRNIEDVKYFVKNSRISALILKPMMLGGILPVIKILDLVKDKNIKTVITSSFESFIGRSYAVIAASLVKQKYAHGLNTENVFEEDLGENVFKVRNGKIRLG